MNKMICPACWGSKQFKGIVSDTICDQCYGIGVCEDEQLTEHFKFSEFIKSQTAMRKHIPNVPSTIEKLNLHTVAKVLEIVRSQFGPINVNSGFRSKKLNSAIGGSSKSSAHMCGLAADFVPVKDISLKTIVDWIIASDMQYDQVIYEGTWVHIGVRSPSGALRKQHLMMFPGGNGKPQYYAYDPNDRRVI